MTLSGWGLTAVWALAGSVGLLLAVSAGRSQFRKWRKVLEHVDVFDRYFWIAAPLMLLAISAIIFVPRWQEPIDLDLQNKLRQTVAQVCAGSFAVFGLLLAIRRAQQNAKSVMTGESKELTGRFFRGMELLGSVRDGSGGKKEASLETRLGAIYALRRLADDSQRDAATISEVLQCYVRVNAPWEPELIDPKTSIQFQRNQPRSDIQASLEVLSRSGTGQSISLPKCDLTGARLESAHLQNACLVESSLDGSILTRVDFTGADLRRLGLRNANLTGACLKGANLDGAEVNGASLLQATFDQRTSFEDADLSKVKFWGPGEKSESERGLAAAQVVKARNWRDAEFSPRFREDLDASCEHAIDGRHPQQEI